jgi:hypothetical protein
MKHFLLISVFLSLVCLRSSSAQEQPPVNSNYLIERGISPRVLDATASIFMQDGRFSEHIILEKKEDKTKYDFCVIYDPSYEQGMDIRVVNYSGRISKKEQKKLKRYIEKSHYFSRMAMDYLYDESTLTFSRRSGDTVVLSYLYRKNDIDNYLRNIKRFRGEIYLVNDRLAKVVLTNTRPLRNKISRYIKTVFFAPAGGGYIVTGYREEMVKGKGKKETHILTRAETTSYTSSGGKVLTWTGMPEVSAARAGDTVTVKLGGPLPILGKEATKLGYQLPRPVGVALFSHLQEQYMQFTGLAVGLDGGQMIDLENVLALEESDVTLTSTITMAKADAWIFPFLNVMFIVGAGENILDANLMVNDELIDFFDRLPGWIIDVPNLPQTVPINSTIRSEIYGGGATLAGGVGDFNLSVNYQLMFTRIVEANTTNMVNIITPMIGYMSPFGVNFMLGGQGQFYNTVVTGYLEFEDSDGDPHKMDYIVDFEPIKWNGMVGIYKGFAKHWELSMQFGFGQRTSLTAVFGYRF